jgi:hypothetical protein
MLIARLLHGCMKRIATEIDIIQRMCVSIMSDFGLDDRAIGVWSPAGTKNFSSSLCVQTGSEAHPASCTMGTGGPFVGAKHGRRVTLTTHLHLVPRLKMRRSYTPLPASATMACSGTALIFFFCRECGLHWTLTSLWQVHCHTEYFSRSRYQT